jgi:hypothetical protein
MNYFFDRKTQSNRFVFIVQVSDHTKKILTGTCTVDQVPHGPCFLVTYRQNEIIQIKSHSRNITGLVDGWVDVVNYIDECHREEHGEVWENGTKLFSSVRNISTSQIICPHWVRYVNCPLFQEKEEEWLSFLV